VANPSYLALTTMLGQILYSGQLSTTTATAVYTVPSGKTVKVAQGSICNTSTAAVLVSVSLLKSGDTADGTHAVISGYSLAAGDTLALKDYLGSAMLAEAEAISVTAGTANAVDVVITGAVSS
jgi:hypothetical protein